MRVLKGLELCGVMTVRAIRAVDRMAALNRHGAWVLIQRTFPRRQRSAVRSRLPDDPKGNGKLAATGVHPGSGTFAGCQRKPGRPPSSVSPVARATYPRVPVEHSKFDSFILLSTGGGHSGARVSFKPALEGTATIHR